MWNLAETIANAKHSMYYSFANILLIVQIFSRLNLIKCLWNHITQAIEDACKLNILHICFIFITLKK